MKTKKLKNLKRRWRKLEPGQRSTFRLLLGIMIGYAILSFFSPQIITDLIWVVTITCLLWLRIAHVRISHYYGYLKGRYRQKEMDRREIFEVRSQHCNLRFAFDKLKYSHEKLKTKYNKLKRSKTIKKQENEQ